MLGKGGKLVERIKNKKVEFAYLKIKQRLEKSMERVRAFQVNRLVVGGKEVYFSEHYASLFNDLLSKVLRQLRAIHSMNQGIVLSGGVFVLQEGSVFYSCGNWSKETKVCFYRLEEIQFCKDCDGKLTRLYNDGKYNLGQQGHYYRCVKCAKMYSQEAVEKIKRSKILK